LSSSSRDLLSGCWSEGGSLSWVGEELMAERATREELCRMEQDAAIVARRKSVTTSVGLNGAGPFSA
jgi:hypothetical protein